jgi:hypothetical protein
MKQAIVAYDNGIHKPEYYAGFDVKYGNTWVQVKKEVLVMPLKDANQIAKSYNAYKKSSHYGVIILDCSIGTMNKTDPTKAYDRAMRGI